MHTGVKTMTQHTCPATHFLLLTIFLTYFHQTKCKEVTTSETVVWNEIPKQFQKRNDHEIQIWTKLIHSMAQHCMVSNLNKTLVLSLQTSVQCANTLFLKKQCFYRAENSYLNSQKHRNLWDTRKTWTSQTKLPWGYHCLGMDMNINRFQKLTSTVEIHNKHFRFNITFSEFRLSRPLPESCSWKHQDEYWEQIHVHRYK